MFTKDLFELLFPLGMILAPAAVTFPVRVAEDRDVPEQRARVRRWSLWLAAGTALAAAIHLGLFFGVSPNAAEMVWMAFFPLWFGLAVPLMRAKRPRMFGPMHGGQTLRAASLHPRDAEPIVPAIALIVAIALWAALTAATAVALVQYSHDVPGVAVVRALGVMFPVAGLVFVLGFGLGSRRIVLEPEPMDGAGSRELTEAYDSLRRFKAWGFYLLGVAGMLTFNVCALLLALLPPESAWMAGVVGGVGGSLGGIAGGIVGGMCSFRRERIERMREELIAGQAT